jgi:hypothetical protein
MAVLRALINGAWVDVGGGSGAAADEVFVGPDDPGLSGSYEMWYDSDAPSPTSGIGIPGGGTTGQVLAKSSSADFDAAWQTPAWLANLPKGLLGKVPYIDQATSGTALVLTASIGINLTPGRAYAFRIGQAGSYITGGVVGDAYKADVQCDGVTIGGTVFSMDVMNSYVSPFTYEVLYTPPDAQMHFFRVAAGRITASGTGSLQARMGLSLFDVGMWS